MVTLVPGSRSIGGLPSIIGLPLNMTRPSLRTISKPMRARGSGVLTLNVASSVNAVPGAIAVLTGANEPRSDNRTSSMARRASTAWPFGDA
jgi:hypothetical protein